VETIGKANLVPRTAVEKQPSLRSRRYICQGTLTVELVGKGSETFAISVQRIIPSRFSRI